MTLFTEKEDLLAVFNSISSLSYIYGKPTFLLGRSQGGCVTGLLAAELKEHLPAIILYYPAFMIPEMAQKEYPVVKKIPPETEIWDMKVGKDYFANLLFFGGNTFITPVNMNPQKNGIHIRSKNKANPSVCCKLKVVLPHLLVSV